MTTTGPPQHLASSASDVEAEPQHAQRSPPVTAAGDSSSKRACGDTDHIFLTNPDLTVRMKCAEDVDEFPYLNGMTVRVICSTGRASEDERFKMCCGIMARRDRLEFVVVDVDEDD